MLQIIAGVILLAIMAPELPPEFRPLMIWGITPETERGSLHEEVTEAGIHSGI